jgi:hypothetical protein
MNGCISGQNGQFLKFVCSSTSDPIDRLEEIARAWMARAKRKYGRFPAKGEGMVKLRNRYRQ